MTNKKYSREEISRLNVKKNAAIIIDNVVYDVSGFIEDHPGGPEILVNNAGKDVSETFHSIGHTEYAKGLSQKFILGEIKDEEKRIVSHPKTLEEESAELLKWHAIKNAYLPPIAVAAFAIFVYLYIF